MEQKQLYKNNYKDCAVFMVCSTVQFIKPYTLIWHKTLKNGVGDGQKQLYENHYKDCAVFSVCLEMTLREPPEFLTP